MRSKTYSDIPACYYRHSSFAKNDLYCPPSGQYSDIRRWGFWWILAWAVVIAKRQRLRRRGGVGLRPTKSRARRWASAGGAVPFPPAVPGAWGPLRGVKGSASPQPSPGRPAGAAASGLALDPAPPLSGCWNGEGVKGSWNTAGSAATEDMPRKPLDAFATTQCFRAGVGLGFQPHPCPAASSGVWGNAPRS